MSTIPNQGQTGHYQEIQEGIDITRVAGESGRQIGIGRGIGEGRGAIARRGRGIEIVTENTIEIEVLGPHKEERKDECM